LTERLLIVGQGSIGQRHLRLARGLLPGADIRVLRHRALESTPEHANGLFSSMEEALAFRPRIAVVANPAPFHMSTALPLAQSGAHLLVEKPLAVAAEDVPPLLAAAKRSGVALLTGYNLRFLPSLQTFRALLQGGAIGRVLSVHCEAGQYLPSWRPAIDYRTSVSARRELGGGALLELSHELDYLRWIFGEVDWVAAVLTRQSDLEVDVEDCAHLVVGFAASVDGRAPLVGAVNLDFVRCDKSRMCTAIGTGGSLRWNGIAGTVDRFDPSAGWSEVFRHTPEPDESYLAEWRNLLGCAAGSETPFVTGEDGLRVLQIVDAARRANATGARATCTRGTATVGQ
jgi:predicted dehydrogenase